MTITSILKNIVIHLRAWIKLIIVLLIGFAIFGFVVFVIYKPMYSVSLNGEFIGYTEDRGRLQKKITTYLNDGDNENVAFVEIEHNPEYRLCLLQKDLTANDDEIFAKVISSGTTYYKFYAILDNGVEKYYVSSFEEAEKVVQDLKDKNSKNQKQITYNLKYESSLKEFTDTETIVSALYIKMPVVKTTKNVNVNTSTTISYENTALGIALIEPVSGLITSRFGSRSNRRSGGHTGLDIATSAGTPIRVAASGTVTYAGWKGSYGNLVIVRHTDSIETYYAHCSAIYVSAGQTVNQGDVISALVSTGNSTGPHLHLEIRVNGAALNPQNYLYY